MSRQQIIAPFSLALVLALGLMVLSVTGCSESSQPETTQQAPAKPLSLEQKDYLVKFVSAGSELLQSLVDCNTQLTKATNQFLEQVQSDNQTTLSEQLLSCTELHQSTHLLHGFSEETQAKMEALHRQLDAPVTLPGYLDATEDYPNSGIIQDLSLKLSQASIREQHRYTSEEEVSLGYSVVAYLLAQPPQQFEPALYWQDTESAPPIEDHPQNRRRLYLTLVIANLKEDSKALLTLWRKQRLPDNWQQTLKWRDLQIQAMKETLANNLSNSIALKALQSWYQQGLIPGVVAATEQNLPQDPKALLNILDSGAASSATTEIEATGSAQQRLSP